MLGHQDDDNEMILDGGGGIPVYTKLGGGNSNIFDFHPETLGNSFQFDLRIFFNMGWEKTTNE